MISEKKNSLKKSFDWYIRAGQEEEGGGEGGGG